MNENVEIKKYPSNRVDTLVTAILKLNKQEISSEVLKQFKKIDEEKGLFELNINNNRFKFQGFNFLKLNVKERNAIYELGNKVEFNKCYEIILHGKNYFIFNTGYHEPKVDVSNSFIPKSYSTFLFDKNFDFIGNTENLLIKNGAIYLEDGSHFGNRMQIIKKGASRLSFDMQKVPNDFLFENENSKLEYWKKHHLEQYNKLISLDKNKTILSQKESENFFFLNKLNTYSIKPFIAFNDNTSYSFGDLEQFKKYNSPTGVIYFTIPPDIKKISEYKNLGLDYYRIFDYIKSGNSSFWNDGGSDNVVFNQDLRTGSTIYTRWGWINHSNKNSISHFNLIEVPITRFENSNLDWLNTSFDIDITDFIPLIELNKIYDMPKLLANEQDSLISHIKKYIETNVFSKYENDLEFYRKNNSSLKGFNQLYLVKNESLLTKNIKINSSSSYGEYKGFSSKNYLNDLIVDNLEYVLRDSHIKVENDTIKIYRVETIDDDSNAYSKILFRGESVRIPSWIRSLNTKHIYEDENIYSYLFFFILSNSLILDQQQKENSKAIGNKYNYNIKKFFQNLKKYYSEQEFLRPYFTFINHLKDTQIHKSISKNQQYLVLQKNLSSLSLVVDLENMEIVYENNESDVIFDLVSAAFSKNYEYLIVPTNEYHYNILDLRSRDSTGKAKKIGDYYYYNENDWYVITVDGYYDKSPQTSDRLYWVYDDKEIYELENFEQRYQPNLLDKIMSDTYKLSENFSIENTFKKNLPPIIEIDSINENNETLNYSIIKRKGGLGDAFIQINGHIRKFIPEPSVNDTIRGTIDLSEYNDLYQNLYVYNQLKEKDSLKALQYGDTDNYISLRAYPNFEEGVKKFYYSSPTSTYTYNKTVSNVTNHVPKFYGVFIGVNKTKENDVFLKWSGRDAEAMEAFVRKSVSKAFNNRKEIYTFTNEKANKEDITNVINDIKKKAKSQDIFMLYISGYGIGLNNINNEKTNDNFPIALSEDLDAKSRYYYIPMYNFNQKLLKDLEIKSDGTSDEAISSAEIKTYFEGLNSNKKIFIVDACFSGLALDELTNYQDKSSDPIADLDDSRKKLMNELKLSSGTIGITASAANQKAKESKDLNHSLLTWSLLKSLSNTYAKDTDDKKVKKISVNHWFENSKELFETDSTLINTSIQKPQIAYPKLRNTMFLGFMDSSIFQELETHLNKSTITLLDLGLKDEDELSNKTIDELKSQYRKVLDSESNNNPELFKTYFGNKTEAYLDYKNSIKVFLKIQEENEKIKIVGIRLKHITPENSRGEDLFDSKDHYKKVNIPLRVQQNNEINFSKFIDFLIPELQKLNKNLN